MFLSETVHSVSANLFVKRKIIKPSVFLITKYARAAGDIQQDILQDGVIALVISKHILHRVYALYVPCRDFVCIQYSSLKCNSQNM